MDLDRLIELLDELEDDGEPDDRPLRCCLACRWRGETDSDECPNCGMRLE